MCQHQHMSWLTGQPPGARECLAQHSTGGYQCSKYWWRLTCGRSSCSERSLILWRTVVGVTSRKGSLMGSLGGGGPGLHIFLAEASQWAVPVHTILHMPPSSPGPLAEAALDRGVAAVLRLVWSASRGGTGGGGGRRPRAVGGGGSTAVTDFSLRRVAVWGRGRWVTCSPGRDLERPGLGRCAPSRSGDSGEARSPVGARLM